MQVSPTDTEGMILGDGFAGKLLARSRCNYDCFDGSDLRDTRLCA